MTYHDVHSNLRRALSLALTVLMVAAALFAAPAPSARALATSAVQFTTTSATFVEDVAGPHNVTVELVDAADDDFTVDVVVVSETADGSDYTWTTETLSFTNGDPIGTTKTIDLLIVADGDAEGNETITLGFDNFVNGGVAGANNEFTATIEDDDGAAFSFALAEASVAEAAGSLSVDVVYTGPDLLADQTVTVGDALSGTATSGSDYTAFADEVLTFMTGTMSGGAQSVTLSVTSDGDVELPETVVLALSASSGPAIGTQGTTTITIEDDDVAVVSVADASSADESGTVDFTVSLTPAAAYDVDFSYTVTEDSPTASALSGVDFGVATPASPITFSAGQTSKTISVPVLGDSIDEGNETFTLTLTGAVNADLGTAVATGTITDDDTADLVITALTSNPVAEGASTSFDVSLATEPIGTVDVAITTSDGTMTVSPSASLSFDSGTWSTPVTVTLGAVDDSSVEGDAAESVDIDVTAAASDLPYVGQTDSLPFTITDNDTATVTFVSGGPTGGTEGADVDIAIRLDLSTTPTGGSLASDVTPTIGFTDDTTTASDYSDASGSLTFAGGSSDGATVTASIALTADGVGEVTEAFDVTLDSVSGPATLGTTTTHGIEITDVDDPVVE
ncbi:MAG: hypothetical protein HKN93_12315, partial [Acidimicrobiia bacterium]|nr:hypothetical protein [Acidimicrobiia bacterium]